MHPWVSEANPVQPGPDESPDPAISSDTESPQPAPTLSANQSAMHEIIQQRQESYENAFPALEFSVIYGGETRLDDIVALAARLGPESVNLDYEHPPQAREDLMYVSMERIKLMLENKLASATLFLTDEPSGSSRKLCVITLDPARLAASNEVATLYLIDPYYEIQGKIIPEKFFDRRNFLEFVFDHEVYHCLESDLIGPQPMSYLEFWGDYYHYRHENGADAFAVAMHIKRHGRVTQFVRSLILVRGLSLYCDDCNHWTPDVIQRVSDIEEDELASMNTMEIFKLASSLGEAAVNGYKEYLIHRASAKEACRLLDSELWTPDSENQLPPPDMERVENMLKMFKNAYRELTGSAFGSNAR